MHACTVARPGEMKPYKGTKYVTVDDRYADGWAYNPTTRRWIKVACQQKKDAVEALPALLVSSLNFVEDNLAVPALPYVRTHVHVVQRTDGGSPLQQVGNSLTPSLTSSSQRERERERAAMAHLAAREAHLDPPPPPSPWVSGEAGAHGE